MKINIINGLDHGLQDTIEYFQWTEYGLQGRLNNYNGLNYGLK
jgi:hypothetical protein